MQIYLVGGAVRDQRLGLPVIDRDWVVVGAQPQALIDKGFKQLDPEFPVFLHPVTGEEYALARRETKSAAGYRGFETDTSIDVSLVDDLRRRDLTINAMAESSEGDLIDPYDGQADLQAGYLRHVSDAFIEDPVRLLRVARFAAKLKGFRLAHGTHRLMKQMVADGAIAELKAERIWQEMQKALSYAQPWRFFEVMNACGGLQVWMPKLSSQMSSGQHGENAAAKPIAAFKRASEQSMSIEIRLASLMVQSGDDLTQLRQHITLSKAAAELIEIAIRLWPNYQVLKTLGAARVFDFLNQAKAWKQPDKFDQLLAVLSAQEGDLASANLLKGIADKIALIDVAELQQQGISGKALGDAITEQRMKIITKTLLSSAD